MSGFNRLFCGHQVTETVHDSTESRDVHTRRWLSTTCLDCDKEFRRPPRRMSHDTRLTIRTHLSYAAMVLAIVAAAVVVVVLS